MYRHSMKKVRTSLGGGGDSLLRCLMYRHLMKKVRTSFGGWGGDSLLRCLMYRQSMKKVRTLAVAGHLNGHPWGEGEGRGG